MDQFSEKLLLNLNSVQQFDDLANFWYKETRCPILVANSSFSKITSNGLDKIAADFPWIEQYLFEGTLTKDIIFDFAHEAISSEEPIIRHFSEKKKVIISAGVHVKHGKILIITFADEELISKIWEPFKILLQAAYVVYSITEHYLDTKEVFLRDLIEGKMRSEENACARAKLLSIKVQKDHPICIMVGRLTEPGVSARKELCEHIKKELFLKSCMLEFGSNIVILILDHTQVSRNSTNLRKAEKYFEKQKAQFCICPPAHRFMVITGQYMEAKSILDMFAAKNDKAPIIFFEQNVLEFILRGFSSDELYMLCLPYVKKLYEYDITAGTDYTRTLLAYLICYGNCAEISEIMGISYNTAKNYISDFDKRFGKDFESFAPALFYSIKSIGILHPDFAKKCEVLENHTRGIKR